MNTAGLMIVLLGMTYASGGYSDFEDKSGFRKEVLEATNRYRSQYGKGPLKLSNKLSNYAQDWADKLERECRFEHRPFPWISGAIRAENLAGRCEFYPSGSDPVYDNWANSPDHKRAMLLDDITEMGVGLGQTRGCQAHCWSTNSQQEAAVIVAMYGN